MVDEPTTALDLTIQVQILALLQGLVRDTGMALLLITHDLGVVADQMIVPYAGRNVEAGPVAPVLGHPRHPCPIGLMQAHPTAETRGHRLPTIPGAPPKLSQRPQGCTFHPECQLAEPACQGAARFGCVVGCPARGMPAAG